jgi:hypothetical protein
MALTTDSFYSLGDTDEYDGDVVYSTLNKYSKTIYDNMTKHNAFLYNLKKKGQIKIVKGGLDIVETINKPSTGRAIGWQSMDDEIKDDPVQVLASAKFGKRFAITNVQIKLSEETMNRGSEKLYDILEARTKNAEAEMNNFIAPALFEPSTEKGIDGLQVLVADKNTAGSVGGIARTNTWWQNQVLNFYSATYDDPSKVTGTMLEEGMNYMLQKCEVLGDRTTSIYTDTIFYNIYRTWLMSKHQDYTNRKVGDLEFTHLEFQGIPVYRDPFCAAGHMYFLNEKYLWLKMEEGFNFKFLKPREPYNKFMKNIPLVFYGCFTISNMMKQGVIFCKNIV